ncbi:MAG: hypothetical protein V3W41_05045, partial [Planctomycetota bacterium]
DPVNHDVTVLVPGNMVLSITTGANPQAPVILLGAITQPSPVVVTAPWGGSLDLGVAGGPQGLTGVELIVDGNNPTSIPDFFAASDDGFPALGILPEYLLIYSGGSNLAGVAFAFQGIVLDPSATAGLDSTEVVDANFTLGTAILAGTTDDGSVEVPFSFGNTFEFHGASYTSAWVVGNGFMTFGAMTTMAFGGFNRDNVLWLNDQPSIAPSYGDWSPGGIGAPSGPNGNTGVLVEQVGNIADIVWGDPQVGEVSHFVDGDLNTFGATLTLNDGVDTNQGFFSIQWPLIDPAVTAEFGHGLIGHTPGAVIAGGAADQDLNNIDGAGAIAAANEAQFEEHDFNASAFSAIGGDGLGLRRSYNNFTVNKAGRSIDFIPLTSGLAGNDGYLAFGDHLVNAQPDDVSGILGAASVDSVGGTLLTIGGVFFGFDPALTGAGTVIFDPAGLALAGTVIGIHDDTGASGLLSMTNAQPLAIRNGQGLEIISPALGGFVGTSVDIQIDFDSGASFTINAAVQQPGFINTVYNLINGAGPADVGASVTHTLAATNTITWYGTTYPDVVINENGNITFGGVATSFQSSATAMFNGFDNGTPTPGTAGPWGDMNASDGTGTYEVLEDTTLGTTLITFRNMEEAFIAVPLGTWTALFEAAGPNTVTWDWSGFTTGLTGGIPTAIGVTNGDTTSGSDTDLSDTLGTGIPGAITAAGGLYQSSLNSPGFVAPDSVVEELPALTDMSTYNGGTMTFIDATGTGDWTIF